MTQQATALWPLHTVLRRPIPHTARTQAWQDLLDDKVDELAGRWDVNRGMLDVPAGPLPHEVRKDYWQLCGDERERITPPAMQSLYSRSYMRATTATHFLAAFCYQHPFSRHRGRLDLLAFFQAGLAGMLQLIGPDGARALHGPAGESWSQGWDMEGLLYGLILLGEKVDAPLRAQARAVFARAAALQAGLARDPEIIGSIGNQRLVWMLGLCNYASFLEDANLGQQADDWCEQTLPLVLDRSGIVVEQIGPCMHYSYTGFFYGWLNLAVRDDRTQAAATVNHLRWFRNRHTRSLRPLAGPSTRVYRDTLQTTVVDLLPAAVQVESLDPQLLTWVEAAMAGAHKPVDTHGEADMLGFTLGHGASPLIWAQLMSNDQARCRGTLPPSSHPSPRGIHIFNRLTYLKRSPMPYVQIQRRYQTQFTMVDMLPFSGIQTFAWEDEPPVLQPTVLHPSTTRAMGLDTARQGVSHNWGCYGAGLIGVDGYCGWDREGDGTLAWLVARYDWLWRVVAFTANSMVVLEFAHHAEPRTTTWTLDAIEPAAPVVQSGIVRFAGRQAALHTTLTQEPGLIETDEQKDAGNTVCQLSYACGELPAAFAWSDGHFQFHSDPVNERRWLDFSDCDHAGNRHHYRLTLDLRLLVSTPGQFGVDTYELAWGSNVTQRQESAKGA